MWNTVKQLLNSKKAMVAFVSALVWVLCKFGLELNADDIYPIVGPLWGFVFAQGVADWKKEAAKILTAAQPVPVLGEPKADEPDPT